MPEDKQSNSNIIERWKDGKKGSKSKGHRRVAELCEETPDTPTE